MIESRKATRCGAMDREVRFSFSWTLLAAWICLSPGLGFFLNAAESTPPNIVFFLADDQRNDTLSCAGHPIIRTPNIDQLAAQGVRFECAYVSHSICWVSRTTILTGLTARSFGEPQQPDRRARRAHAFCPDLIRGRDTVRLLRQVARARCRGAFGRRSILTISRASFAIRTSSVKRTAACVTKPT